MDADLEKKIDASVAAINSLYRAQQIDASTYYKCLLTAAHECSAAGDQLKAMALAQTIPLEYFQEVHRDQMLEDPDFAAISYVLALNLLEAGFVSLGTRFSATQAPGRA